MFFTLKTSISESSYLSDKTYCESQELRSAYFLQDFLCLEENAIAIPDMSKVIIIPIGMLDPV